MPIDTSILQGIKPVQMKDPLDQYSNFLTVQGQLQQNEARGMELQDAQRKIATRNALSAAYAAGMGPDGQLDYDKVGANLTGAGYGDLYPEIQEAKIKLSKAQNDSDKVFSDLVTDRLKIGQSQLSGITTPEQFARFTEASFRDPILSRFFASRGHTLEDALGKLQHAVQTGGFEKMLMEAKAGTREANENQYLQMDGGDHQDLLSVSKYGTPGSKLVRSVAVARKTPGSHGSSPASPAEPKPVKPTKFPASQVKSLSDDAQYVESAEIQRQRATRLLQMLNDPRQRVITGLGSGVRLGALKATGLIGPNARDEVNNTEMLRARLAEMTLDGQRLYGLGARGMDTIAERRYMEQGFGTPDDDRNTLIQKLKGYVQKLDAKVSGARTRLKTINNDDLYANGIIYDNAFVPLHEMDPKIVKLLRDHRDNPQAVADFEKRYGKGAAARALGDQ